MKQKNDFKIDNLARLHYPGNTMKQNREVFAYDIWDEFCLRNENMFWNDVGAYALAKLLKERGLITYRRGINGGLLCKPQVELTEALVFEVIEEFASRSWWSRFLYSYKANKELSLLAGVF